MLWIWAVLLVLTMLACWALNLVGLPGNWFIVLSAALYAWLMPVHRADFGWLVVVMVLVLAILGEVFEFLAGAAGTMKAGGTKRGAMLALLGSGLGGLLGLFIGVPVPVIGSVVGALIFSAIGALLGAIAGEMWAGRDINHSWSVGHGAFWGRLLGTFGKAIVGVTMIVVVIAAIVV